MLVSTIQTYFSQTEKLGRPVYLVHPPLITSSDCEGAGEVFMVDPKNKKPASPSSNESGGSEELYFRDPKYLTVSSQLHLEAFSAELGSVYAFSPTFRAEESDTPRHLAEFYMLEAEFRNITLHQIMDSVRMLIQSVTNTFMSDLNSKQLLEYFADTRRGDSIEQVVDLQERWSKLLQRWETMDYTSAIRLLQEANDSKEGKLFEHRPTWERGLHLEHERWLTETFANNRPVFVTDYPKVVKPFYMLPSKPYLRDENAELSSDCQETVACFDLLLPFGYCEVVGGSLREHRLPHLIANMREKGLLREVEAGTAESYPFLRPNESLGSLKWYADLRRFGSSPHGGYGLGFDRFLAYLTGVTNVRDVVAFPRVWGKADC